MALTHGTPTRTAIADAVVDRLDLGSGTASGRIKIFTAGDALLVSLPLSNPAFGAAANGVATASAVTTANATGAGTAAKFSAVDRNDVVIFSGTVSASGGGGDLTITNVNIAIGDPISVSSLAYTAPT